MDSYSAGPFSFVFFVITSDGMETFTYRRHREQGKGSLVNTLFPTYVGGPSFNDVFVNTLLIRN